MKHRLLIPQNKLMTYTILYMGKMRIFLDLIPK